MLSESCLLQEYYLTFVSPEFLNCRVSGRILQLETVTQSEAMRRRYRYLSHFSLTTTFQVHCCLLVFNAIAVCVKFLIIIHPFFQLCEIDLSELLPPEALIPFMDEIKKREKQRKQVARKVLLAVQCNIV